MLNSINMTPTTDLDRLRVLLGLVADPTRQDIIFLFRERAEWNAGQIAERFALSRPTVSHHVGLLVRGGVLSVRKDGKERWFRLKKDEVVGLLKWAATLLDSCC